MKVKETVGAIGELTLVGAASTVLAVAGVVQLAAAGVELLVVAPFARRTTRAPQLTVILPRTEPIDLRLPKAA